MIRDFEYTVVVLWEIKELEKSLTKDLGQDYFWTDRDCLRRSDLRTTTTDKREYPGSRPGLVRGRRSLEIETEGTLVWCGGDEEGQEQ